LVLRGLALRLVKEAAIWLRDRRRFNVVQCRGRPRLAPVVRFGGWKNLAVTFVAAGPQVSTSTRMLLVRRGQGDFALDAGGRRFAT